MKKQSFFLFGLVSITLMGVIPLAAQGDLAAIQQRINTQFRLTRTTADRSDIVTAGDVVTLHKGNLVMFAYADVPATNNYKSGGIGQGFGTNMIMVNPNTVQRTFVPDEKCWITGIQVQKDGVLFQLFSDPYNGTRYYGNLKVLFPNKKEVPSVDVALGLIAEVLTVDGQNEQQELAQPGRLRPAVGDVVQVPAIAPPPPPSDAPPPTIELGQTKDKVTAGFGQPLRVANLGAKTIFYYKDMKVTFMDGKVSDVE